MLRDLLQHHHLANTTPEFVRPANLLQLPDTAIATHAKPPAAQYKPCTNVDRAVLPLAFMGHQASKFQMLNADGVQHGTHALHNVGGHEVLNLAF